MKKTFIIAGGGTGGHIYPGIAIAQALKKIGPSNEIIFVGTLTGLENKIVPREGFVLELIEVGKLNRAGGLGTIIKTLLQLPLAFIKSFQILKKYEPSFVLGVGGYASGPFVLMASFMGYKTAIWEANAHPGLTNRWLSRFVRKAYIVFSEAKEKLRARRVELTGLPVRIEIENSSPPINSDLFRVLVTGGSQGASAINQVVGSLITEGGIPGVKFVHQTGIHDFSELKKKYQGLESQVHVYEFLYDMEIQYANCDLVICRGGASTVSEIAACGKVAIIIPLPTAADNHQQKNAEALVNNKAGRLLLQKDLSVESLKKEIELLKNNIELRKQISENVKKLFIPQAAQIIANDLMAGAHN